MKEKGFKNSVKQTNRYGNCNCDFLPFSGPGTRPNGCAQDSRWELRHGGITRPLLLTGTRVEFIPASLACALSCAKPVQDKRSLRAALTYHSYQESWVAESSSLLNPLFWATVKAWRQNLYWLCAVRKISFGFVLQQGHGANLSSLLLFGPLN